jgi:hypothetical protein
VAEVGVRRKRRAPNRNFRLKKPVWQDPFPFIPGTEPEKRLFEALVRNRFYFVFQGTLPEYADLRKLPTVHVPNFQPDIILPEYRVILDPFGIFHHSLPDAVKRDAVKSVVYRALGYHFYHPWWDDKGFLWEQDGAFERIGFDALEVLRRVPELWRPPVAKLTDPKDIQAKAQQGYRLGASLGAGASSVAIANSKRKRSKPLTFRPSGRRRRIRHRR